MRTSERMNNCRAVGDDVRCTMALINAGVPNHGNSPKGEFRSFRGIGATDCQIQTVGILIF